MNNDSTKQLNECPYEACKNGDLIKVKQLINKTNANVKDTSGRKSTCLHFACGYGRTDICEYLLNDCQADPCIKDTGGLEPIHNASSFGHLDVIQLLLKYKANINALDNWNWTPLHEAVSKCRIDVILVLVKNKADLNIKNLDGKTPIDLCNQKNVQDIFNGEYKKDEFMESIRTGDVDKFTQLLTPFNLNCNTNDGRRSTPLHLASGYNKSKLVKILLENGANIHSIDKGGLVPLHNACSYGHIETASLLLENGADPNIGDMWSFTPLHEAVLKKRKEISSLLLSYKGDPYIKNCYGKSSLDLCKEQKDDDLYNFILNEFMGYSLITAVKENNFLNVKKILNENVTLINFKHSRLNETVLTASFNEKNYQLIDYLIKRGADLYSNNLDKNKKTLLHKSVESMDLECIYFFLNLIKNDFELNMQLYDESLSNFIDSKLIDLNGESPLHYAARSNSFQICKILIMFGFEINRKSVNNFYPHDLCTDESLKNFLLEKFNSIKLDEDRNLCKQSLLEACKSGNLDVVKSIITKYSDLVNCNDKEGRLSTPLHFASGYNRLEVCKYLIENGANIFAYDKGLLQPIHNAASYGHVEIANLLIKSGCNLNAQDAYLYTPLHEATVKKKYEICKFLIKNGADPSIRNRDGMSSIDLAIQLGDEDLIDILKGCNSLLEACKCGNFDKVKKLVNNENINCCETTGRKSSLLHLAAGFNHIKIAEYLLENKIYTEIRDKGGLVALHNAASYGHVEMAALLLKYNPNLINLTDKWGYTALHEAAQKGRTQMCALLLEHGIDASIRNQDSKTALDLAEADDVKILLENSMPLFSVKCVKQVKTHTNKNKSDINLSNRDETELDGSEFEPSSQCLTKMKLINNKTAKTIKYNKTEKNESGDGCIDFSLKNTSKFDQLTLNDFLTQIDEASSIEIFEREKISLEILSEMTNEQLKEIGIEAYGSRHKILKSIENLLIKFNDPFYDVPQTGSLIIELDINENEFENVKNEMLNSIRVHKDDNSNQTIKHYEILKIEKIKNRRLWSRYLNRKKEIQEENMGHENERFLFHGSPFLMNIIEKGFDERHACIYGLFGAGLYFAENSSKSNQYIYGIGGGPGCPEHKNKNCTECSRQLLLCRVCLGKSYVLLSSNKLAHAPPGHHSVCGRPSQGGLVYPEYVVYRGEQAYPEYLITYKIAE